MSSMKTYCRSNYVRSVINRHMRDRPFDAFVGKRAFVACNSSKHRAMMMDHMFMSALQVVRGTSSAIFWPVEEHVL